ncbi:MAG TPA: division/cell wall cluster transcriptional repressor MraZ [Myxococcota bacterium]|nr:division/cell wall cluster transcriptional repressor MraZ [Myxococcota bacterium]HRY91895.1 division/cell wall cluster transcriptional repressor MraZ [Myxococcota bacterium]HSA22517.1 division/cell wall cluster transcriptional repressor MraZ [Myxococcota bacterium]
MFNGRYEHTIDSKGRVSIPSRFREVLSARYRDERLIVTSFNEPCLMAFPPAEWQALEQKVRALPRFDPKVMQFKRLFISGASECAIDKNGRILIPPVLRDFAGLGREVIWAGMVESIEIWSKQNWDRMFEQSRGQGPDLGGALGELGL